MIADRGWVLLEDDKNLLAADNVVPVLTKELADEYGDDLESLLNRLSAALTTAELTEMNRQFDVEQLDPEDIAAAWLADNGFIDG